MNKLAIIAGAALLSASTIGLAGEYTPPAPMSLGSYFYVGLEGGISTMFLSHSNFSNFIEEKNDDWGISGRFFGGYLFQVSKKTYLGVEVGYSAYQGSKFKPTAASGETGSIDITGYNVDLMLAAQYNFTNHFNMFAKAGVAYVWQNFDIDGSLSLADIGITASESARVTNKEVRDGGFLPKVVVGFGLDFTNSFGMTLSYSQLFGETLPTETDDIISVGSIYLGMVYRFV